jgi:hypothetical protein
MSPSRNHDVVGPVVGTGPTASAGGVTALARPTGPPDDRRVLVGSSVHDGGEAEDAARAVVRA